MTTAERVRQTRKRAYIAMLESYEDLPNASTKAILGNLERQIKLMDNPDQKQTARAIAADLIGELCKRYRIAIG